MHSVFHHKDKAICEAIMPEIVTHLEGGRNVLKEEKQISAKVSVIPHGCHELDQEKYWNLYNTPHTILQVGFGLKYKNFQDSIKATAILKQKYPDVFFTALFSESPHGRMEHQAYYNELIDLVRELDIESNIAIVRGFQSDEVINTYMKTNNIAVFPYVAQKGHEVFGSTGIARMAMSKGIPVVSSSGAHFSDLPTLKADSPVEIANIISELFESKQKIQDQISKQNEYVIKYSWDNVAEMYKKVFEE
jgi:glycosyltransferase involved in cell wall biosynthesis